ncbi:MAG: hypothetical protein KC419_17400 [Anaerolineales bacterium]|nr:hypothetical protein [Anaerolineales bacterium]MCA9930265.1 hypothetical protein [Anaerolineales bacterium]
MSKRKETPAVNSLLGLSKPEKRPSNKPQKADKSRTEDRATYYIGPALKEQIREISVSWGVPASQVARYFLEFALDAFEAGRVPDPPLSPSDSPAYRNNIDF